MPYLKKPLCRACGEVMPGVNLLMVCRQCKQKLIENGEIHLKPQEKR